MISAGNARCGDQRYHRNLSGSALGKVPRLAAADPELYLYLIRYSHLLQISGTIRLNQVHISLAGFDNRVQAPLEYVTEWQMQKAVHLLQRHEKKLIDVAPSVGYESDAAFSKALKRVVGLTPGEYRHNSGAAQQQ